MLDKVYEFALDRKLLRSETGYYEDILFYRHIELSLDGTFCGMEVNDNKKEQNKFRHPSFSPVDGNNSHPPLLYIYAKWLKKFMNGEIDKKFQSFYEQMKILSSLSPELKAVYMFLTNLFENDILNTDNYLKTEFEELKKSKNERIGFRVDAEYIEETVEWKPFYETEYKKLECFQSSSKKGEQTYSISVITGEKIIPTRIVQNLRVNGITGPKNGDSFISFGKDAYRSYGKVDAYNSCLSKEEADTIILGLEYLLKNNYNRNLNLVHWYKNDMEIDVVKGLDNPKSFVSEDTYKEFEKEYDSLSKSNEKENKDDKERQEFALSRCLDSFFTKENYDVNRIKEEIKDNELYFFKCVSSNSRLQLYDFHFSSIEQLYNNIKQFYKDSELLKISKRHFYYNSKITNIWSILFSVLYERNANDKNKQINDELKQYKMPLFYSIIYGKQLPKEIVRKAIYNLRKDISCGKNPPFTLYQILKIYINRDCRQKGKKDIIMTDLNEQNNSIGYNLGRYLSLCDYIQYTAMNGENQTSLSNKYCSEMLRNPNRAFINIERQLDIYFMKIKKNNEKKFTSLKYEHHKICDVFNSELPTKLDIKEQASLFLGRSQEEYYRMKINIDNKNNNNNEKKGE